MGSIPAHALRDTLRGSQSEDLPVVYPPSWRTVAEPDFAIRLLHDHPFAHLISGADALRATRVPFVTEVDRGRPIRLRAHLNARNPQAVSLDGAPVLVVFSGPSTYVSPHWRADTTRAGTYDYEEVQVRGRARILGGIDAFRQLLDDLSALIEPQYAEVGDYPVWRTSMAPAGYIERLFPQITCFAVDVDSVTAIAKLHQQFPDEDRRAVATHLGRCQRDDARAIGARIRSSLRGLAEVAPAATPLPDTAREERHAR